MLDHIHGVFVDQRTHHRLAIEGIPNSQRFVCGQKFFAHFVGDRLVHDDAPSGSATLTGSADRAEEDRLRRHLDIGAGRNDERVIAAQFHDRSAEPAMNCLRDM